MNIKSVTALCGLALLALSNAVQGDDTIPVNGRNLASADMVQNGRTTGTFRWTGNKKWRFSAPNANVVLDFTELQCDQDSVILKRDSYWQKLDTKTRRVYTSFDNFKTTTQTLDLKNLTPGKDRSAISTPNSAPSSPTLRSGASKIRVQVTWKNTDPTPIQYHWLDSRGTAGRKFTIQPGKTRTEGSWATHAFEFFKNGNKFKQIILDDKRNQLYELATGDSGQNAVPIQEFIGKYEQRPASNGWHTGTISDAGNGQLRWTNEANVSWLLRPDPKSGKLLTGDDNPYQRQGITDFHIERNADRSIKGYRFANNLFWRKSRASSDSGRIAALIQELVGEYEFQPASNGWHTGTLSDAGNGQLRWTNEAKATWLLSPDLASNKLLTGSDNPYQRQGIKDFHIERNADGSIKGYRFANNLFSRKSQSNGNGSNPTEPVVQGTRLDQHTFLCSHNAFATRADNWMHAMQNHNIEKQLQNGVRAFMLDIDYRERKTGVGGALLSVVDNAPSGVYLEHKMTGKPSAGFTYALPRQALWETLHLFDRFLENNPEEIIMVTLQDRTSPAQLEGALYEASQIFIYETTNFSKQKASQQITPQDLDIPDLDKFVKRKWRNDIDSIRIPSGVTITAWEDRNYRKKKYGPFVGPISIKNVPGRNDWDSMQVRITSTDRRIGIARYIYNPADPKQWAVKDNGWPTLEWMRENNRRLVIFSDEPGRPVPYYWDYVVENSYGNTADKVEPRSEGAGKQPLDAVIPDSSVKKLFVMNHFRTATAEAAAEFDNRYSKILNRVENFAKPAAGRYPNWIAVDWYEKANYGAGKVVAELNRRR